MVCSRSFLVSVGIVMSCLYAGDLLAEEINQISMDAKSRAKIIRSQADQQARGSMATATGAPKVVSGCGTVNIGNLTTTNGVAPQNMTTIITGDVINYVGPGGCNH